MTSKSSMEELKEEMKILFTLVGIDGTLWLDHDVKFDVAWDFVSTNFIPREEATSLADKVDVASVNFLNKSMLNNALHGKTPTPDSGSKQSVTFNNGSTVEFGDTGEDKLRGFKNGFDSGSKPLDEVSGVFASAYLKLSLELDLKFGDGTGQFGQVVSNHLKALAEELTPYLSEGGHNEQEGKKKESNWAKGTDWAKNRKDLTPTKVSEEQKGLNETK